MKQKHDLTGLPTDPGCYLYKDKNGKIIYVGKAKNLKKRVSSYFTKTHEDAKTAALVSHIAEIDHIITKTEVEALILEDTLIKKHKPKYNIDLKDSRTYAYIEQTPGDFPRFQVYRPNQNKKIKTKGKLFGPFTSGKARNDILQVINKTFKLRTCKNLPKRACLRYHIGICSAPCINKISKTDYAKDVQKGIDIIKGKTKEVITEIEHDMKQASKKQEFERALNYREQLTSLEYLKERQNVERKRTYNEDIINYVTKNGKTYITMFNIYKGTLNNKQEFILDTTQNPLEEFIKRFYKDQSIPKELILPEEVDPAIIEYLSTKKKENQNTKKLEKVRQVVPKQGEKKELLDLVMRNIEISFFGDLEKLEYLRRILNLQEIPHVIECFDISHLSGTNIVAAMVQFRNAKSDKSNYRRFKMRTVHQNDDFASMREVVKRRYKKLKNENLDLPDLILIDGGIGQLNAAIESLKELSLKIPIISLAKEFEEIYLPGRKEPIRLDDKNKGRLLLQQIRDEAHRFGITYNRLLRKKERFSK